MRRKVQEDRVAVGLAAAQHEPAIGREIAGMTCQELDLEVSRHRFACESAGCICEIEVDECEIGVGRAQDVVAAGGKQTPRGVAGSRESLR